MYVDIDSQGRITINDLTADQAFYLGLAVKVVAEMQITNTINSNYLRQVAFEIEQIHSKPKAASCQVETIRATYKPQF